MRPDKDDLDDEIRGHLAISIKERIERGEDPASARLAALKEFGNVTLTRDLKSSISGTENVVFSAPRPDAVWRM